MSRNLIDAVVLGNLYALLKAYLRGGSGRTYFADVKARIEGCYYYPDVMVTCDDRDLSSSLVKRYPYLVVEVRCFAAMGRGCGCCIPSARGMVVS